MTTSTVVEHNDFLGRTARTGSWAELSRGTFRLAGDYLAAGDSRAAVDLLEVSLEEADELRDIYGRWPIEIEGWLADRGVPDVDIKAERARLQLLLGLAPSQDIQSEWSCYRTAITRAVDSCRAADITAAGAIETAHQVWSGIHDRAVDRMAGYIDIVVRLCGEDAVPVIWDFLMADWYDAHSRRFSLDNQPWSTSADQLMTAIVDGFHAHLVGRDKQGDIEIIEQDDRIGFRFAPCGSGGRMLDPAMSEDGIPRTAAPYNFAVTTEEHDWAWNRTGICTYCVHCCLLNVVMPIDRIGFPTRVVEPPVWTGGGESATSCTWWVYRDPADVPEEYYRQVGRTSRRRENSND